MGAFDKVPGRPSLATFHLRRIVPSATHAMGTIARGEAAFLQSKIACDTVVFVVCAPLAQGRTAESEGSCVPEIDRPPPAPQPGGTELTMPRPLRRQLDEYLSEEPESSPRLRTLFRRIDRDYRRADSDRASL